MLEKVISGFQTGVDFAGIVAAHINKIPTGGYIPKGFKTLDGPKQQYAKLYGAIEHSSSGYNHRTWDNVQSSDGTLRFACNFKSPGEICTLNAIKNWQKPYLDVHVVDAGFICMGLTDPNDIRLYILDWIKVNDIKILNVAGNAEKTCPGIYSIVLDFLREVFKNNGTESVSKAS
jgi:hypothetical protein